jgi:hypothetical protein
MLAPGSYIPDLAWVLTSPATETPQTDSTAASWPTTPCPARTRSLPTSPSTRQDREAGSASPDASTPAPDPTFALPLADGPAIPNRVILEEDYPGSRYAHNQAICARPSGPGAPRITRVLSVRRC